MELDCHNRKVLQAVQTLADNPSLRYPTVLTDKSRAELTPRPCHALDADRVSTPKAIDEFFKADSSLTAHTDTCTLAAHPPLAISAVFALALTEDATLSGTLAMSALTTSLDTGLTDSRECLFFELITTANIARTTRLNKSLFSAA